MNKLVIVLTAILLFACTKNKVVKDQAPAPTEITSDTVVAIEPHNSRNSLDYLGMYRGTLPCEGCDSLQISLELTEGFQYLMVKQYFGTSKRIETKGSFSWNEIGNGIILDNIADGSNQYLVYENALIQLGHGGKRITGKSSNKYTLNKLSESDAAKTDSRPRRQRTTLADKKWSLSEMQNSKIIAQSDYFLTFNDDDTFNAYAGCNRLRGQFSVTGSKIKMGNIVATRMACSDMSAERQLLKILENTDNYVINAEVLLLRNKEIVLAKFNAQNK